MVHDWSDVETSWKPASVGIGGMSNHSPSQISRLEIDLTSGNAGVTIRTLGGLRVEVDGAIISLSPDQITLLGGLAVLGSSRSRTQLCERLWPDVALKSARRRIRTALYRLGEVADRTLIKQGTQLGLHPDAEVDICIERSYLSRPQDDYHELVLTLSQTAGDLLPEIDEEWAVIEREHHRLLKLMRLDDAALACLDRGQLGLAAVAAHTAVRIDPLRTTSINNLAEAFRLLGDNRLAQQYLVGLEHALTGSAQHRTEPQLITAGALR